MADRANRKLTAGSLAEETLAAGPSGAIHCIPFGPGERAHEESIDCWCGPARLTDEPRVIVHERRATS